MSKADAPLEPDEVLPAKPGHNSEEMRLAANYALQAHTMTVTGAEMMVTGALACGLIMQRGKDSLPHGGFTRWEKKYLKGIPTRTRHRYLQYAQAMKRLRGSKFATVANLLDVPPSELTAERIRQIAPKVREATDGKSFTELGRELGIVKPKNTKSQRALDKRARRTGNQEQDRILDATEWAAELLMLLARARNHTDHLPGQERSNILAAFAGTINMMGVRPEDLAKVTS